ncbi:MAG: class I SAM-dependent methyltransferase [Caulobacteraceae bacterium]
MAQPLRALASMNGRFALHLARTMVLGPRARQDTAAFHTHVEARGFEFTEVWADNNIAYAGPLLRRFAKERQTIAYLEIGVYEGRSLAFVDWLLPGRLATTVIEPFFDAALNPEERYHAVEPRFRRNVERLDLRRFTLVKGFSTYELPKMLQRGERFDLIYVDGSHTAWAVFVDLFYCAALLEVGGMMILDDYWRQESEIGGPGVKQAVDRFHGAMRRYFEIQAVYRQVALRKVAEIPR